jgi:HD-like signal output (HDOD) protein
MALEEVLSLTSSPDADAKQVAAAIGRDPVLTAKVLRVSNSSFFGFLFKTRDLENAVVRLGIRQIRQITTALSIGKLFAGEGSGEGYSRLAVWRHSVAAGVMNELLTKCCPIYRLRQLAGEALIAGLVHDIGIILMDQYLAEEYRPLPEKALATRTPLYLLERQAFGFHHADLGGRVLHKWRLPGEVVAAVARHHDAPGAEEELLTRSTMLSEILVASAKVGYGDQMQVSRKVFSQLQSDLRLMGKAMVMLRKHFPARLREALEVFAIEGQEPDQDGGDAGGKAAAADEPKRDAS